MFQQALYKIWLWIYQHCQPESSQWVLGLEEVREHAEEKAAQAIKETEEAVALAIQKQYESYNQKFKTKRIKDAQQYNSRILNLEAKNNELRELVNQTREERDDVKRNLVKIRKEYLEAKKRRLLD